MSKELDYIAELERENRLLGERCNQLLKDKGELTDKIADIKANCDLAIEGRDIKIKELELELTVEKDQHQEEINLHLHAENYIKSLEEELTKKADTNHSLVEQMAKLEEENAGLKERVEKAKELIEDMYDKIPASHSDYYKDVMERARQFIKEIEK